MSDSLIVYFYPAIEEPSKCILVKILAYPHQLQFNNIINVEVYLMDQINLISLTIKEIL